MNPCNHSPHQFSKNFLIYFFQVTQEIFLGFLLSTVYTEGTGAGKTQGMLVTYQDTRK